MSVDARGENLIFLISQPRAGSTLFQRMLASHPVIHTMSEPWLMLHPFYALRESGHQAEYEADFAQRATADFLNTLPTGEDAYIEGVRRMYTYLYAQALQGSGKSRFLDKTPAYYFVIPELYRAFPEARYVILLRNPLAVLSSILTKWIKEQWFDMHIYRHDLLRAPHLLLQGIGVLGSQGLVVHYEQLVEQPLVEARRVCTGLNIDFMPSMVDYGRVDLPKWRLGDDIEVYQHGKPMQQNATKWTTGLDHPQIWRFTNDYLQMLGRETITHMGYCYDDLAQTLDARRPSSRQLRCTLSLSWTLKQPIAQGVRKGSRDLLDTGARKLAFTLSRFGLR